ncbi:heme ABC exporter, ATP-binding protein CcmA [Thioclava sp. SK-1]|uniref:heme ABC exporter ATP-binding protein CcmA n=1 Tax=Thioclava sp. SK-1 TaxID=1889770 RepID=UPI000826290A|nr:heme ABC exporter ATP-binding protein CcmA [Thioclava sp. SK-1]OCX63085.1 heme ABC exporter, ATP-binding protein CcmA [Thioclava sp. SK-1]
MTILSAENLTVARGGVPVLHGLSFSLAAGQVLVLRGPNGLGKTTLLRTVAGLQPAMAGKIHAPEDSIAYAAHADGLKSMLSVVENLSFWAATYGGSDIAPALLQMNLTGLAQRPAATLSAGQKRRLGLARLLVTRRPVWVLDEPTVSLDTESVALFAQTVRAHLAQGGAALMATHIDLGLTEARVLDLSAYRASLHNGAADPSGFGAGRGDHGDDDFGAFL